MEKFFFPPLGKRIPIDSSQSHPYGGVCIGFPSPWNNPAINWVNWLLLESSVWACLETSIGTELAAISSIVLSSILLLLSPNGKFEETPSLSYSGVSTVSIAKEAKY